MQDFYLYCSISEQHRNEVLLFPLGETKRVIRERESAGARFSTTGGQTSFCFEGVFVPALQT